MGPWWAWFYAPFYVYFRMAYFCATLTIVFFQRHSFFLLSVVSFLGVRFVLCGLFLFPYCIVLVCACPSDIVPLMRFFSKRSFLSVLLDGLFCFSCIFPIVSIRNSRYACSGFSSRRFRSCRPGSGLRISNLSTCSILQFR